MWRIATRDLTVSRDGAVLEAWCAACGRFLPMREVELSRGLRADLPRWFDVHRHCVVACTSCGAGWLVDTWSALPRGPYVHDRDALDDLGDSIERGATRAADFVENGVRRVMGHAPVRSSSMHVDRSAEDAELDAFLKHESDILEDPLEAKFRALEEQAKKKG
jgi:hypothetical protein